MMQQSSLWLHGSANHYQTELESSYSLSAFFFFTDWGVFEGNKRGQKKAQHTVALIQPRRLTPPCPVGSLGEGRQLVKRCSLI